MREWQKSVRELCPSQACILIWLAPEVKSASNFVCIALAVQRLAAEEPHSPHQPPGAAAAMHATVLLRPAHGSGADQHG